MKDLLISSVDRNDRMRPNGHMIIPGPDEILKQFGTHYQPIVDLNTGGVSGFEALARRIHEDGTMHPAGDVIEEIEKDPERLYSLIRAGLTSIQKDIVPLFQRIDSFYVSVNISPVVLGGGTIAVMLEDLGLDRYLNRLVCEVTERQSLTDIGREALERGRSLGIRVAVDDFGTGNSDIAQIAGLDLDILKIDRSLVVPALTNRTAARLLRGIVALASALHMHTVAEGIETWEQAFFLRAAGVDAGQGWFWSKALPADQLETVLQKGFPLTDRPAVSES